MLLATAEQIVIVHSVTETPADLIEDAAAAVNSYRRARSMVKSVIVRPLAFGIPPASAPGRSLGSDLAQAMQNSIGAIVFLDDIRPNVAYELGFFHGQRRSVLLISQNDVGAAWASISDLAGSPLLDLNRSPLTPGVHAYLDALYESLSTPVPFRAPALPTRNRNMLRDLAAQAEIPVHLHESDFGAAICIDTWGGVVFDVGQNLSAEAGFKIALRTIDLGSTYSIYFRVRFRGPDRKQEMLWLGLNSNQVVIGFEANERNLPAQRATADWRMLTGHFSELLNLGQVLGAHGPEHLEKIRVRAGGDQVDPFATTAAYEIGYFELTGLDW
jgi:hypothetical protein